MIGVALLHGVLLVSRSKIMIGGTDYVNNRAIQDIATEQLRTEGNEIDETTIKADMYYTYNPDL